MPVAPIPDLPAATPEQEGWIQTGRLIYCRFVLEAEIDETHHQVKHSGSRDHPCGHARSGAINDRLISYLPTKAPETGHYRFRRAIA